MGSISLSPESGLEIIRTKNGNSNSWVRKYLSLMCALILATLVGLVGGIYGNSYFGASLGGLINDGNRNGQTVIREDSANYYPRRPISLGGGSGTHWNHTDEQAKWFAMKNILHGHRPASFSTRNLSFDRIRSNRATNTFNIESNDVLVFLHIQKTAGSTLEKFLTRFLDIPLPCKCVEGRKKCRCYRTSRGRSEWLFSRFSTGWSCGLHADYTELVVSNCVDNVLDKRERAQVKRQYYYTTLLREPIARYISEFRHVQRGATWKNSPHICNGRSPTPEELPMCFDPDIGWEDVTLNEFMDCPHNLANNRLTRMLADLTLVGCYNINFLSPTKREAVMLESAKRNLANMAWFGLQEDMDGSQKLMSSVRTRSKSNNTIITPMQMERVRQMNALDVQLYDYAQNLFRKRAAEMGLSLAAAVDPAVSGDGNGKDLEFENEDEGIL